MAEQNEEGTSPTDYDEKKNDGDSQSDLQASVLFVKNVDSPISMKNISSHIDVHALHGSPLDSLFNSLAGIWCPSLLDNDRLDSKISPRIKALLGELKITLGTSRRNADTSQLDINDYSTFVMGKVTQ